MDNIKIQIILETIDNIFSKLDSAKRITAYSHSISVAQNCAMLASKRNLDIEIAWIIGYLHDIYSFTTDIQDYHAISGAAQLRPILRNAKVFNSDEATLIMNAVMYHSEKSSIHGEYDELLKDADTLNHYTSNLGKQVEISEKRRIKKLSDELGFKTMIDRYTNEYVPTKLNKKRFIDNAKKLAEKKIVGSKNDKDFMELIRYCPEDNAFDELIFGWCATFVYHCLFISGLKLPIKMPESQNRLMGVIPFKEWAIRNDFYIEYQDGIVPDMGDIVIYNDIISQQNKYKNISLEGLKAEHIGIVIEVMEDRMMVAEGNVDNLNVSGVIIRELNRNISGYIRIPEDYTYSIL